MNPVEKNAQAIKELQQRQTRSARHLFVLSLCLDALVVILFYNGVLAPKEALGLIFVNLCWIVVGDVRDHQ
jgi:hypothetical protein